MSDSSVGQTISLVSFEGVDREMPDGSEARRWLTPAEETTWSAFKVPKRSREWLAGRVAAKRAVAARHGRTGPDAFLSIEIATVREGPERGRPFYRMDGERGALDLSIAHCRGTAVATLGDREGERTGIDLERVEARSRSFEAVALSAGERELLADAGSPQRERIVTAAWALKEAFLKAVGIGLRAPLPKLSVAPDLLRDIGVACCRTGVASALIPADVSIHHLHPELAQLDHRQLTVTVTELGESVCVRVRLCSTAPDQENDR